MSRPSNAPESTRAAKTLVAVEDVAIAMARLQQRIADLERENDFLRSRTPIAAACAPLSLATA